MRGSGVLAQVAVGSFLYHRIIPSHPISIYNLNLLPLALNNNNNNNNNNSKSSSINRTVTSSSVLVFVNNNKKERSFAASTSSPVPSSQETDTTEEEEEEEALEHVSQIKTILERLKKNRDMLFNEVKLTVMIEDPRDVERRRLLGIDDENAPTRDELADVLVQVNEGKIPQDRLALRMLAEEMAQWPNLEVEAPKKKPPGKSLYARFTDTGVDIQEAAKRLNIDWDSAAEIEDAETDDMEVPPAVGYGALYLVTAFPVIIGISVVLILFYNSLQ